jgi:hypothetical protein
MSLPLQPLVEAYGKPWREFRTAVGARHTVLNRLKVEGLTLSVADRFAMKCNLHPAEVWGLDAWLEAAEARPI